MRYSITIGLFALSAFMGLSAKTEKGIDRLLQGNKRFVEAKLEHPRRTEKIRLKTLSGQSPFAIVLGCADSRVTPEIIFDQGIGDLFVVRVAGNVIGPLELESINYSALALQSSVVLVLGHQGCGAVNATLQGKTEGIPAVAALIEPVIKEVEKEHPSNILETAIKVNAKRMRDHILQTPIIKKLVADQKLEVYAGYYNKQTGKVDILD